MNIMWDLSTLEAIEILASNTKMDTIDHYMFDN